MRKTIFKRLEARGLIANYNRLRKNLPPKLPSKVLIWENTLSEGIRTPSVFLTYVEKVKLAKMMDELGVSIVGVGRPALSEEEKNNIRKIANESFQQTSLVASARTEKSEIDACLECGVREIVIYTPFNGLNLQYRLKTTHEQVLAKTIESIQYAKKHGVKVDFVLEDATRTPIEDIMKIFGEAVKSGADRLVIADTLGFLRPLSIRYLVSHIREGLKELKVKETPLSIHCHNDFGLATANTLAAVEEGVSCAHTCMVGFGERAGVAPLEEVVTALELLYNIDSGVDLGRLYRVAQTTEKALALPVQFHKPLVGDNAFLAELEEHSEDSVERQLAFVPFPPEIVGREAEYFLGRRKVKSLIEFWLVRGGIKATPVQVEQIIRQMRRLHESADKGEAQMTFYEIKKLMKDLRKGVSDEGFWRIVEEVTGQKPKPTTKPRLLST